MNKLYDVCIVGGGASGLAAAVYIKQKNADISVAVLERLSRVGKKLIITGNGRCNISISDESIFHYHGNNAAFAEYALKRYDNEHISDFFVSIGVPFCCDDKGRMYPYSLQASAVVDALRFSCEALNVELFTECTVNGFNTDSHGYELKTEKGNFFSKNIIFAAGLYSGGIRLGCDGSVLKMLRAKGLGAVRTTPAIVQIKTENEITRSIKGIKTDATVTLNINGKEICSNKGEVLFCDYGLSGPPVLAVAREVERQKGEKFIYLDIMPDMTFDEVLNLLIKLKSKLAYRKVDEFLSGLINKRLGQAVIKFAGFKLSSAVSDLNEKDIRKIAQIIKQFPFKAISTTGFENSQVTAGGLDTAEFDCKTMMSKKYSGLYATGEILDIDGDCGGYNLHFAFSSGFCAADSILKGYKND